MPQLLAANDVSPLLGNIDGNQYANGVQLPDSRAPAFRLANAQFVTVNGKAAIKIEGACLDSSGKQASFYTGLTVASQENDENLWQAFRQSPTQPEFESQRKTFDTALGSIVWQN